MLAREVEGALGADRTDLQRLDRVGEVLGRAGGAGEVQHRVDRSGDGDALDDVVLHEDEAGVVGQVGDVLTVTGQEVVDGDDLPLAREQRVAEVRTDEPRPARDDRTRHQRPTPW